MRSYSLLKLAGIIIISITGFITVHAQDEGMSFGVRGGVIASKQDVEEGAIDEDPKSKLGLDFAGVLNFPIGDGPLDFQPEVHWLQKGYKIEDAQAAGDITSTLNYVEIPLLLRLNIGDAAKIFAFAGPSIGFFVGGTYESDLLGTTDLDSDDIESTEWSAHVGAGIGIWIFEFDIRYMQGLSDVSADSSSGKAKNSAFGAGLTFMF